MNRDTQELADRLIEKLIRYKHFAPILVQEKDLTPEFAQILVLHRLAERLRLSPMQARTISLRLLAEYDAEARP